jgi:hypothetical protein
MIIRLSSGHSCEENQSSKVKLNAPKMPKCLLTLGHDSLLVTDIIFEYHVQCAELVSPKIKRIPLKKNYVHVVYVLHLNFLFNRTDEWIESK